MEYDYAMVASMLEIELIACLHLLSFVCREGLSLLFPWPKNLTAVGLVQLEPAPILMWWLNEWALARILVQQ